MRTKQLTSSIVGTLFDCVIRNKRL